MKKSIISIMMLLVITLVGCTSGVNNKEIKEIESWTNMSIKDVNYKEYDFNETNGKKTVIKVWASWCSICLAGLEEYNELSRDYTDANVISLVAPGNKGEMKTEEFIQWFESLTEYSDIRVLLDEEAKFVEEFKIRAYPSYVFLDEKNELIEVVIGHKSNDDIINKLEQ